MIDLSGSELFAVLTKALLGAGVGRAAADDAANAALWLHAKGYNGTNAVIRASAGSSSATSLGLTAIDLLVSRRTDAATVADLDSPLLFVGLLGVASSTAGLRFTATALGGQSVVAITPSTIDGPADTLVAPITVECQREPGDESQPHARIMRLSLGDDDWHQVNQAAARTYVPSNERSRATGAGAGLIDAD